MENNASHNSVLIEQTLSHVQLRPCHLLIICQKSQTPQISVTTMACFVLQFAPEPAITGCHSDAAPPGATGGRWPE